MNTAQELSPARPFRHGGTAAFAQPTLHAFGPGVPAPAMKEAAQVFETKAGVKIEVVAGPTGAWLERAKTEGDLIFSGSEVMMTISWQPWAARSPRRRSRRPTSGRPPSWCGRAIPKASKGSPISSRAILRSWSSTTRGQQGLWEDMAGRTGEIAKVKALRSKIVAFAPNSAAARQTWIDRPEIDAWIIWMIWQVSSRNLADLVEVEPEYRI